MTPAVASIRSHDRRMIALGRANEVRTARAKLKQDLREGKVSIEQVLVRPPEHVSTAQVFDLLVAVPKVGPVRAGRLLNTARISHAKAVGALSDRQRSCLVELLCS
jgi:hypothetical protein